MEELEEGRAHLVEDLKKEAHLEEDIERKEAHSVGRLTEGPDPVQKLWSGTER